MEGLILVLLLIGALAFWVCAIAEPPSSEQRAAQVKRDLKRTKEDALAHMDAITQAHKREMFEEVREANRRANDAFCEEARREARRAVRRARQREGR